MIYQNNLRNRVYLCRECLSITRIVSIQKKSKDGWRGFYDERCDDRHIHKHGTYMNHREKHLNDIYKKAQLQ